VARPKQHHYVTRAYLEGFLGPSQQHLVCYGRGRGPFRRCPEDLACQRNYYALKKEGGTWDDSIETLIEKTVESPGLPVIQKLASGNTRLSWQDRNRISLLIAFQEMRTPSARERARTFSRVLSERITRDIKAADPHQNSVQFVGESGKTGTVTLDEMIKVHDEICDDHSMEIHRMLVGAALKLSDLLKYMKFTVHYSTGNEEFVTTDTPVIRVFHGGAPIGTGINRKDVELRFPLSSKAFLTLTHDAKLMELLEHASGSQRSRLLEVLPEIRIKHVVDSEVAALNRAHARHSHRWLFASNELEWASAVLSGASAAPGISDLSSYDLIHFQSTVNYDPKMDSEGQVRRS
jgi:hypothetical protein